MDSAESSVAFFAQTWSFHLSASQTKKKKSQLCGEARTIAHTVHNKDLN